MHKDRIRVLLCSVGFLAAFWSETTSLQAAQPDTLAREKSHSYLALGAGANLWTEADNVFDGTVTLSSIFPVWGPLSFQFDVGVWGFRKTPVVARIGVAMRYDIPLAQRISVYPKVGEGFVFVPNFHASLGCGISYLFSQKTGVFLEAGGHLTYRESQRRTNYYFMAMYVSAGLTFH